MLEVADKVLAGVKAVREIAKKIHDVELLSRIADLMGDSADLKMEMAELKAEIIRVRDENDALKRHRIVLPKIRTTR